MTQWHNSQSHYGAISLFLHWLMAILIIIMLALGWGREYAHGETKTLMMDAHKTIGVLILILICLRLSWRFYSRVPLLPETLSHNKKLVAHATHALLYFLIFVMPFSGWLMMSAMGRPLYVFRVILLPPLIQNSSDLVPLLKEIHEISAYGLCFLMSLHLSAALIHQYIYKDDIMRRMLPFLKSRKDNS